MINFYFSSSETCKEISDALMMLSLFPDQVDSFLVLSFEVIDSPLVLSFEVNDSSEELFSLKTSFTGLFFCPNFCHFSIGTKTNF